MKHIRVTVLASILIFAINPEIYSQDQNEALRTVIIQPYTITITWNKTTNLIFPYAIKSLDKGSPDILAQKATGAENVLYVKAAIANFLQTNLSVITSDGKFYSFLLNYEPSPAALNFSLSNDSDTKKKPIVMLPGINEAEIRLLSKKVAAKKRVINGVRTATSKMLLQLDGIYVTNDVMYLAIQLKNRSFINYDMEALRFFIKDERRFKRTASQEIEVDPLQVYGDTAVVKGKSKNVIVYALQKFTLPAKKYLSIELMEKNGGRNLHLNVSDRVLVNARVLNSE